MHLYTVAFILALLAFGGVAAYLGDVIGYRLGRKRLSLLGLRPRTTATLIGVLAGILIPAVTVAVGAWQVGTVRTALFQLQDIKNQVATLTHERDGLQQQRDALFEGKKRAQEAAQQARDDAARERTRLGEVQQHLDAAQSSLSHAESSLAVLRGESGRLRAEGTRLNGALQSVRQDLTSAKQHLENAKVQLTQLKTTRLQLQAQVDEKQKQVDGLSQQVTTLTTELQTQEKRLIDQSQALHNVFAASRPIVDLGTELVRAVVTRTNDIDALKNQLVELLILADHAVETAGAAKGENGRFVRAVGPTPSDVAPDESGFAPEGRVLGLVVKQLWDARETSHVVRVVVVRRTFLNQQVYVVFYAQPNLLVFRKGQTIVQREIPPRQSDVDAFEQLWRLIADPKRSEVRRQAQAAEMLPDPNTERFGEVEVRQLYEAAAKCAGRDTPVTVRVEAAEDTYTVGPLAITLDVSPARGKSP